MENRDWLSDEKQIEIPRGVFERWLKSTEELGKIDWLNEEFSQLGKKRKRGNPYPEEIEEIERKKQIIEMIGEYDWNKMMEKLREENSEKEMTKTMKKLGEGVKIHPPYSQQRNFIEDIITTLRGDKGIICKAEMGFGKTQSTTLALLKTKIFHRMDGKIVVMGPKDTLPFWAKTMMTCGFRVEIFGTGFVTKKMNIDESIDCVLVCPSFFDKFDRENDLTRWMKGQKMLAVVIDEVHKNSNMEKPRAQTIQSFCEEHPTVGITGTPVTNRQTDIVNLLRICCNIPPLEDVPHIINKYIDRYLHQYPVPPIPTKLEEIDINMPIPPSVREKQLEIISDIKKAIDQKLQIQTENRFLDRSHILQRRENKSTITQLTASIMTNITILRQFISQSQPKIDKLSQIIHSRCPHQKSVIFTAFKKSADLIAHNLTSQGLRVATFHSDILPVDKESRLKNFQEGSLQILIGTYKSLGTGINCQSAQNIFHYDQEFNLSNIQQATARVHRRGNPHPLVRSFTIRVDGSIDQLMWSLIHQKQENINALYIRGYQNLLNPTVLSTQNILHCCHQLQGTPHFNSQ